jgi:8-oxo-dGTP diphosphatase
MRRYGDSAIAGQRYKIRHGAYAVLVRNRQLLLTHQAAPFYEFQLPGGGIDPGESAIQALHREVFEETGWRIARPRRLGVFRRFVLMPEYEIWAEKVCHIYMATPVRCYGPPTEVGHSAHWVTPEAAKHALHNDGDRNFVEAVFG